MDSELPVVENVGGRAALCSISAARSRYLADPESHPREHITLPVPPSMSLADKLALARRFYPIFNCDDSLIFENRIEFIRRVPVVKV